MPTAAEQADPVLAALLQRFAVADACWFNSVRPDGRAHSTPMWYVWSDGRASVVTSAGSVKAANVRANPSVVLTHPDTVDPLMLEGIAESDNGLRDTLQPLFQAKYDWDIATDTTYDQIIVVRPTRLIAWGKYGQGSWTGAQIEAFSAE